MGVFLIYDRKSSGHLSVPLDKDIITIGRDTGNDILIDYDDEVSAKHTKIIKEQDQFFIEDLGSTNKTLVNGKEITARTRLSNNDKIKTGGVIFTFSDKSEVPISTVHSSVQHTVMAGFQPTVHSAVAPTTPSSGLKAKLIYERDGQGEVSVLLDKASTTLGRAPGNEIILDFDTEVSGKHAKITKEEQNFFIEDLGSTNKTFVNGTEVKKKIQLKNADKIKTGKTTFTFVNPAEITPLLDKTMPSMAGTVPSVKKTVPSSSPAIDPSHTVPSSSDIATHSATVPSSGSIKSEQPLPVRRRDKGWKKYVLSCASVIFITIFALFCLSQYKFTDNSENVDEVFDKAEEYYLDKNYDDAMEKYKEVMEKNPTKLEAYERMGKIHETRFEYEEAIKIYKKANDIDDPTDANVIKLIDQLMSEKTDRGEEAEKRLAFFNYIGNVYFLEDRYSEAEKWYRGVRSAYEGTMDKDHMDIHEEIQDLYGDSLAGIARISLTHHKYSEAEEKYKEVLTDKISPDNPDARTGLGYVYTGKGEWARGEEYFGKVMEAELEEWEKPKKIEAKLGLAGLYKAKKDYDKSIKLYRDIRNEYPDVIASYTGEAEVFILKKEYERAKDILDEAQKEEDNNPNIYITRSKAYFYEKNYTGAEEELKKALNILKNSFEAKLWQAKIYKETDKPDVGIKKLTDEILALDPENFNALKERAEIYYSEKDYDRAIKDGKQAEEADPNDIELCLLLGDASYEKKNYGDVIHYYDKKGDRVREIVEYDEKRCDKLGKAYEQTGNQSKADEWYERAEMIRAQKS